MYSTGFNEILQLQAPDYCFKLNVYRQEAFIFFAGYSTASIIHVNLVHSKMTIIHDRLMPTKFPKEA